MLAELGVVPDELDPMTGMAFDLLRPKLERDAKKYEDVKMHSLYDGLLQRDNGQSEIVRERMETSSN